MPNKQGTIKKEKAKQKRVVKQKPKTAKDGTARGRPAWTPPDLGMVEKLAAQGLREREIAAALSISYQTLNEKKKEFTDFSDAIERGRGKGAAIVTSKLMEQVQLGNVQAIIHFTKTRLGWRETTVNKNIDLSAIANMSEEELEQLERRLGI